MKLLIEIPEEVKQAFDCAKRNELKDGYYDHGGVIGAAIKKGKPLDTVLDEIMAEINEQYDRVHPYNISCAEGLEMALEIIDKYRAERGGEDADSD